MARPRLEEYNLRRELMKLLQIQNSRIKKAYSEESARWRALGEEESNKGKRALDPALSKEMSVAVDLVNCLFKVGGNAPEGAVKDKDGNSGFDFVEDDAPNVKKKMNDLMRKMNGGG